MLPRCLGVPDPRIATGRHSEKLPTAAFTTGNGGGTLRKNASEDFQSALWAVDDGIFHRCKDGGHFAADHMDRKTIANYSLGIWIPGLFDVFKCGKTVVGRIAQGTTQIPDTTSTQCQTQKTPCPKAGGKERKSSITDKLFVCS